jgi:2-dehydropantoate 2-reductase
MDRLAARFGRNAVGGCAAKVAATLDEEGCIVQLAPFQDIAYGEMDGSRSSRIMAVDEFMRGASFEARLSARIALEMWEKWALLATLGGVTCLMRGNLGEIEASRRRRDRLSLPPCTATCRRSDPSRPIRSWVTCSLALAAHRCRRRCWQRLTPIFASISGAWLVRNRGAATRILATRAKCPELKGDA